jgi:hypothetical protein
MSHWEAKSEQLSFTENKSNERNTDEILRTNPGFVTDTPYEPNSLSQLPDWSQGQE